MEKDFLNKITELIQENIADERFGVSELAREVGMSRSNLLRKVKKLSRLSVSQFIRQVRLKAAMEMLRQTSLNVSEVSFKVGFASTSYFIKCFRDYYGYPPGEVGNRENTESQRGNVGTGKTRRWVWAAGLGLAGLLLAAGLYAVLKPKSGKNEELEKSIAVLPFINDSNDSTNVYIINGLMEAILNNLQKVQDLRVISRTSVERYRGVAKTIPEMANELNVNYFVEGSGQKIGDQILLNIQLIEAQTDKHLWTEQYRREAKDIFELQAEVARNIADKIEAIITPEEAEQIDKPPTDNLVAYDHFLKGRELLNTGDPAYFKEAIAQFETAIENDPEFARAYAGIAITYYFLDLFHAEKKYTMLINNFADKALLLEDKLPQGYIAKAMYYMNNNAYEEAVPYLEKALEYNPNSALVINILSDFYTSFIPDTEKYLHYALKGIQLDIAAHDSATASIIYLHLSNALIQSGFLAEAEIFIDKSLEFDPENLYSEYVKAFIVYARNRDLQETLDLLIGTLNKDTNRLDVMQEVGKICYYMRDYDRAYHYYRKFLEIKETEDLVIYEYENAKIGLVLSEVGFEERSQKYFRDFKMYAEQSQSVYKSLSLAAYYSYHGEAENAIKQLEIFSQQTNYHYWVILFLKIDPLMDNIKDHPEFERILRDLEINFWRRNKHIKASLKEKKLL